MLPTWSTRGAGAPQATLGAMMCDRTIVTTDVGGNREVLEVGLKGWIAEGATPKSFALALERCWVAQGFWAQMGAQAHAKALEVAGAEPSKRLLEVLESAGNQRNPN